MSETLKEIMQRVARATKFRPRGSQETWDVYRAALLPHAETRDYASAHEVRLGKAQADWNPDDVDAFRTRFDERARPEPGPPPPVVTTVSGGTVDVSDQARLDQAVCDLAQKQLRRFIEMREEDPDRELAVMISMVMPSGEVQIAASSRDDRFSILRAFAQQHAILGFTVAADVFIHGIHNGAATKRDALLIHVGTHTSRWIFVQPYRYEEQDHRRRVVIEERLPDQNLRDQPAGRRVDDPYADLLCTVPVPARPQ